MFLVLPSNVQISAANVHVALGFDLGSTNTIPFLIYPPQFLSQLSANFPRLTANEHIYPALTCLTGTLLQWIPLISTFLNLPSLSGPIISYCLRLIDPFRTIPDRIGSPSLSKVSVM
jgi:hypothetical protein